MYIDLHDWDMDIRGATLTARPSTATVLRQLWVTLLCAVLIGLLMWALGLPPGSHAVTRQQRQVQQIERRIEAAREQVQRLRSSATFGEAGSVTRRMHDNLRADIERWSEELERQRAKLASTTPTLGPSGDALYWAAVGLLGLIGLGLPALAPLARLTLEYEGPPGRGALTVRQRFLIGRTQRHDLSRAVTIGVHVQRLITSQHRTSRVEDHGWLWMVMLAARPAEETPRSDGVDPLKPRVVLALAVECHPVLPPRLADLTARVKVVVRYLEAVTALPVSPPVLADVVAIERTWWGRRWKMRIRRESPESPGATA